MVKVQLSNINKNKIVITCVYCEERIFYCGSCPQKETLKAYQKDEKDKLHFALLKMSVKHNNEQKHI